MKEWFPFTVFWFVLISLPFFVILFQIRGISNKPQWFRKNWFGLVVATIGLAMAWFIIYAVVMILSDPGM
jgi:hypothetical protein